MFNSTTQFKLTRRIFSSALSNVSFPLTFDEWKEIDSDLQAAALFVNFYREITSAWGKFPNSPITPDIAVSVVVENLFKNVPKILEEPERFTSGYIHVITVKRLISEVRNKGINYVFNNECSNFMYDPELDDEIDLYDLVAAATEAYEVTYASEELWAIIEGMGPKAEKVANHLITGDSLRKTRPDVIDYHNDRLADVSVSRKEFDAIKEQIKSKIVHLGFAFGY